MDELVWTNEYELWADSQRVALRVFRIACGLDSRREKAQALIPRLMQRTARRANAYAEWLFDNPTWK